jgi:hypothetical protein
MRLRKTNVAYAGTHEPGGGVIAPWCVAEGLLACVAKS